MKLSVIKTLLVSIGWFILKIRAQHDTHYVTNGVQNEHAHCPENCLECTKSERPNSIGHTQHSRSDCRKCKSGNFLSGHVCIRCRANCSECSAQSQCIKCHDGYYGPECRSCSEGCQTQCDVTDGICPICKHGFSGSRCDQCSDGNYGNECQRQCPLGCKTCESLSKCNSCQDGFFMEGDLCTKCETGCDKCSANGICADCKIGYYLTNGQRCAECSGGCSSECNRNNGECSKCYQGYTGSKCDLTCPVGCQTCESSSKCNTCKPGFFLKNDLCKGCASGCKYVCHTSNGHCSPCKQGYTGSRCENCSPGRHGNFCELFCPHGCQTCESATECHTCRNGFFLEGNLCKECATGCATCSANNACTDCKNGYYSTNGQICVECSKGCYYACDGTSGNCNKCHGGFTGPKCDQCSPGKHGSYCNLPCPSGCQTCDSELVCNSCKRGFFPHENLCKVCKNECSICSSYDRCSSCETGFYGKDCSQKCSVGCSPSNCEKDSGKCKCRYEFEGETCTRCTKVGYCYRYCPEGCSTCNQGYYCTSCRNGYFLNKTNCQKCKINCKRCASYNDCLECYNGYYGGVCEHKCSVGCKYNRCDLQSGNCSCKYTFSGDKCETCTDYRYCPNYCPTGCMSCYQGRDCMACKDRHYLQSNRCNRCKSHCTKCSSENDCSGCDKGYFGSSCQSKCAIGCTFGKCKKESGNCSCKSKFKGLKCDKCIDGYYGPNCIYPCKQNCKTCNSYDRCDTCDIGKFLENDKCNTCRNGCSKCSSYENCLECMSNFIGERCDRCERGRYGKYCQQVCPANCLSGICDRQSGNCHSCMGKFSGPKCTECIIGYHGASCDESCPSNCKENQCSKTGYCKNGCNDHFYGSTCKDCDRGWFGTHCNHSCPRNCAFGKCDEDGTCERCTRHFSGKTCDKCVDGFFGPNCTMQCSGTCKRNTCNRIDGKCKSCKSSFYGDKCTERCSMHCAHKNCSQTTGSCHGGCIAGFSGNKCCMKGDLCITCSSSDECTECVAGRYNTNCSGACPNNCADRTCDQENGTCRSCIESFSGPFCSISLGIPEDSSVNIKEAVIGGVGLVIVVVILIVAMLLIFNRKRPTSHKNHTSGMDGAANIDVHQEEQGPISLINISRHRAEREPRDQAGTSHRQSEEMVLSNHQASSNQPIVVIYDRSEESVYYNDDGMSGIAVKHLDAYIKNKDSDFFKREFEELPKGLVKSYTEAMKKENASKNRYNTIYPYDETRVKLRDSPSDYINASYIDGFQRKRQYIAALGPIAKATDNFVTFWKMIWQQKADKIVMVTNLVEKTVSKCEQYWPNVNVTRGYGYIMVKCHSEDVYAEYIVRSFTVTKGKEERSLYHVHYTAWPDKGVPDDVTSLIEFRNKVNSVKVTLGGPVIVHCSAGVGRTGTYIALDYLTAKGNKTGFVDFFDCVKKLRHQRTTLVQTSEQYEYLHRAVLYTLTFGSEPIPADKFCTFLSSGASETQLETQFEKMHQCREKIPDEELQSIANNKTLTNLNRKGADIPGDTYRPWLHLGRTHGSSSYINAVFVNSFKVKKQFILTQTPLPSTMKDFLTMIIQEKCSCIVSMDPDGLSDKSIGKYLPADSSVLRIGSFKVKVTTNESSHNYILRTLAITSNLSAEPTTHSVQHFQYTQWPERSKTPASADHFLQLVKSVQQTSERAGSSSPVVVHCLTGSERSGLLCVVVSLLQKMEIEHVVSVINTVRQVKLRRPRAIPNKKQFMFCHQCVAAYLKSFDIYSNFS